MSNIGKGDHRQIQFGNRFTTLGDSGAKEMKTRTFHGMCKQLGIDPRDL